MNENLTRGESGNGGESGEPLIEVSSLSAPGARKLLTMWRLDRERMILAQRLESVGHGMCAYDLEAAETLLVVEVANGIVEHLVEYCGAPRARDQPIAEDLRVWAARYEAELVS